MANESLNAAKNKKECEFYTKLEEIQVEINNYIDKFKDQVVLCNCDDPIESNFTIFFLTNFNRLGLKELIAISYKTSPIAGTEVGKKSEPYVLRIKSTKEYLTGTQTDLNPETAKLIIKAAGTNVMTPIAGNFAKDENGAPIQEYVEKPCFTKNGKPILKKGEQVTTFIQQDVYYEAGDFRSDIAISLLQESDIVVTNPPFHLFKEFVSLIMKYEKKFLIFGDMNAILYVDIFPLIKDGKMWLGCSGSTHNFKITEEYYKENKTSDKVKEKNGEYYMTQNKVYWFTNLDHEKRHQIFTLDFGYKYKEHESTYPKYSNYNAIHIEKANEIPYDYTENMGVPISFLEKCCPEQFEIVDRCDTPKIGKTAKYKRLIIKFKKEYMESHPEQFKKGNK